jgi:hypothetical protein
MSLFNKLRVAVVPQTFPETIKSITLGGDIPADILKYINPFYAPAQLQYIDWRYLAINLPAA